MEILLAYGWVEKIYKEPTFGKQYPCPVPGCKSTDIGDETTERHGSYVRCHTCKIRTSTYNHKDSSRDAWKEFKR